jgi:hypothetical protein
MSKPPHIGYEGKKADDTNEVIRKFGGLVSPSYKKVLSAKYHKRSYGRNRRG